MYSEDRSSCGSVYYPRAPCFSAQKQRDACRSPPATLINVSMASSVHSLQTPLPADADQHSHIQPFFKPEEAHLRRDGQTLLPAEEEDLASACQSATTHNNAHANFDAYSNSHALFNSENIDPRSGTASNALSAITTGPMGMGRGRSGKRKSRASSKVPMKVFSAEPANFMAMVHNLTGLPLNTFPLPGTHQNPMQKPLPSPPLHPVSQDMIWSPCLNSVCDQRVHLGSVHNTAFTPGKNSSIRGQISAAISPRLRQPMRKYRSEDGSHMDYCNENKTSQDDVDGVGYDRLNHQDCAEARKF